MRVPGEEPLTVLVRVGHQRSRWVVFDRTLPERGALKEVKKASLPKQLVKGPVLLRYSAGRLRALWKAGIVIRVRVVPRLMSPYGSSPINLLNGTQVLNIAAGLTPARVASPRASPGGGSLTILPNSTQVLDTAVGPAPYLRGLRARWRGTMPETR